MFDENHDPVFDDAFRKVLQLHRTLYEEELVVPDIFTLQQEAVPNFASGQHTYMVVHEYDQKVFNDPALSQIAGACSNAIMPGATRSTFIWTALYLMGADPVDVERAWNLQQFFGGKAKDGQYHVIKRWALEFGLGTPHKEVIQDPEVQAAFSQWKDLDGRRPAAGDRDHPRRRQDHVVPGMGLEHDVRGPGLHPRRAVRGRARRQAARQRRGAQEALPRMTL